MSHGNTIAHRNRRKYHRNTACLCHAKLYGVNDLVKIHMAWNDLVVRTYDTDHRFCHLFFRESKCIKQTSVRRLLYAGFNIVASHILLLYLLYL